METVSLHAKADWSKWIPVIILVIGSLVLICLINLSFQFKVN